MNGRGVPQKRARPSSRGSTPSQWQPPPVIEISSDDESDAASRPPTKRQKSTTPLANGASASSSFTGLVAKPASSAAQTAKSKSVNLKESQPDQRDSYHNNNNGYTSSATRFKKYSLPPRSEAQATDASGILKSSLSEGQPDSNQRPPRQLHLADSRSSASYLTNGRTDRGQDPAGKRTIISTQSMKDPKFFSSSEKSRAESAQKRTLEEIALEEQASTDLLQLFQKPSASNNHNKTAELTRTSLHSSQKSVIEVPVPVRPSLAPAKAAKPTTSSSVFPKFSLEVPLSQSEDPAVQKAKKKALFEELKRSTDVAEKRLPEVEKYFGQTGFSKAFETRKDAERRKRAAPVYKRDIDVKKFFEETDFDAMWAEMQVEAGVPPNQVTKWNLEINPEETNKLPRRYDYDGDQLLKEILNENFAQHLNPPLTFKNDVNNRRINSMFQFMGEYITRDGVKLAAPSKNRGCGCQGQCIPSVCTCLHKQVPVDPFNPSNKATYTKRIDTYYQSPKDSSITVLQPAYIANELRAENAHYEITECNELCGCGPSCWNRVVGRGRTLSLEIYMTERCGFGVRHPHGPILKGQFIDTYLGEVIPWWELEDREEAKPEGAPSYIYSLDWFSSYQPNHVDGEYFGSPMRFVNHSCSPNARSFPVQTHHGDNKVYHLAFFAIRDIPAGEQITIDYQPQDAIPEEDEDDRVKAAQSREGSSSDGASGESSAGSEDEIVVAAENKSSGSSRASRSRSKGKDKVQGEKVGESKPRPKTFRDIADDPVEDEDGRSRCYCGAPNCRVWLWRAGGRQRRKRRHQ